MINQENLTNASDTFSSKHALNSRYAWFIWSLGAGFFLVEYLARVAPAVMVPELMSAFSINATGLGVFSALFYYAYVGMQVPVGSLMDRFGPHRLLTAMATLCAVGCFIFGMTENLFLAKVGRFLTGFGAAFAFVGTLKIATLWFSPTRIGLLAGATQALGMLGAAFGQGPTALLTSHFGWRQTMFLIGAMLLILAALIWIFVQDREVFANQDQTAADASADSVREHILPSLKLAFKNPQTWLVSLFAGLLFAPTAAFAEFWGPTYLVNVYGINYTVAGSAISAIFLGWAVGGPIAGYVSDKMQLRKPIMYFSAVACLILMTAVLYIPNLSITWLFVLLFAYGLSNVGVATTYAIACEINPRNISATSMAFCNMASVLVGSAFHPLIGKFLDMQWDGKMIDGVMVYSIQAYKNAMLLIPICLIICVVVCLFIKETHCKVADTGTA